MYSILPNDILNIIVDKLDIISLIRLNATCKDCTNIGLNRKILQTPIHYMNKTVLRV